MVHALAIVCGPREDFITYRVCTTYVGIPRPSTLTFGSIRSLLTIIIADGVVRAIREPDTPPPPIHQVRTMCRI